VTIEPRFNGPPGSANGGYTCGTLARFVDGPAEVTLRRPPPVGRPLEVERDAGGGAALLDRGEVVAEARPSDLPGEAPTPVDPEAAAWAVQDSPFLDPHAHPFPTCFVCGPGRTPGDGLRIFAGPVPERDVFAAPWIPAAELAGADGHVCSEFIWAALDCPTSVPVANDPGEPDFRPIVLARLAARLLAPVEPRREHTVVSWPIEIDGRKRRAGAALFDDRGDLLATSRALWIELKPAPS
jgi:hypothetical protein